MKNLDISNVPNSVLIGTAIEDLYYCISGDDDHNYRFREEMFRAVTGRDEAEFKKLFYGHNFYDLLDNVEVCSIAVNYVEYMLQNDVQSRLKALTETLKTVEKENNNSPEIKKLEREQFLLRAFNDDKKDLLNNIKTIAKKITSPQNTNIYICTASLSGDDPFVISNSSVVSGLDNRDTYYVEGKKKWAGIDRRLAKLKRELSATAASGV